MRLPIPSDPDTESRERVSASEQDVRTKKEQSVSDAAEQPPCGRKRTGRVAAQRRRGPALTLQEMAIFSMFGSLMFAMTIAMSSLPNVHLLGMFITLLTVVYRVKALIPIYLFVFIYGLYYGFGVWWLPYLYIWTILWAAVMPIPRQLPKGARMVLYPVVGGLHGLLFGTLWAPAQMIFMMTKDSFSVEALLLWIANGLPFDAIHGVSNFVFGFLVLPLSELLLRLERQIRRHG